MKIVIVTDAWHPQTNGVVTTYVNTIAELEAMGHSVDVIEPSAYRHIGIPTYSEIQLSVNGFDVGKRILDAMPDAVHIATEGPLGWSARRFLKRGGALHYLGAHEVPRVRAVSYRSAPVLGLRGHAPISLPRRGNAVHDAYAAE